MKNATFRGIFCVSRAEHLASGGTRYLARFSSSAGKGSKSHGLPFSFRSAPLKCYCAVSLPHAPLPPLLSLPDLLSRTRVLLGFAPPLPTQGEGALG